MKRRTPLGPLSPNPPAVITHGVVAKVSKNKGLSGNSFQEAPALEKPAPIKTVSLECTEVFTPSPLTQKKNLSYEELLAKYGTLLDKVWALEQARVADQALIKQLLLSLKEGGAVNATLERKVASLRISTSSSSPSSSSSFTSTLSSTSPSSSSPFSNCNDAGAVSPKFALSASSPLSPITRTSQMQPKSCSAESNKAVEYANELRSLRVEFAQLAKNFSRASFRQQDNLESTVAEKASLELELKEALLTIKELKAELHQGKIPKEHPSEFNQALQGSELSGNNNVYRAPMSTGRSSPKSGAADASPVISNNPGFLQVLQMRDKES